MKKLITSIASLCASVLTVASVSFTANADPLFYDRSSDQGIELQIGDEIIYYFENWGNGTGTEIACPDMGDMLFNNWHYPNWDRIPYSPEHCKTTFARTNFGDESYGDFYMHSGGVTVDSLTEITVTVPSSITFDDLKAIVDDEQSIIMRRGIYGKPETTYIMMSFLPRAESISYAKELTEKLNETTEVYSCTVANDLVIGATLIERTTEKNKSILVYYRWFKDKEKNEERLKEISDILEDAGYKFHVVTNNAQYEFLWDEDMSLIDEAAAAKLVYDKTGYALPHGIDFANDVAGEMFEHESIEVLNNIPGDANCDGKFSIADSAAILQSMANQDKYGLSLQGEYNGDIYGNYDGISGLDALEVQKILAGIA